MVGREDVCVWGVRLGRGTDGLMTSALTVERLRVTL